MRATISVSMARLPVPGSDDGKWGEILNNFLLQAHDDEGALKSGSVTGAALANGSVTAAKLHSGVKSTLDAALSQVVLDKQWVVAGPVNVAAVDVDYIVPAFISLPAGATAVITGVRARIRSGTSATLRVTLNGTPVSAIGSVTATTSGAAVSGLSVSIADGDLIAPVVDSTSGSPQNLTLQITYRVTA